MSTPKNLNISVKKGESVLVGKALFTITKSGSGRVKIDFLADESIPIRRLGFQTKSQLISLLKDLASIFKKEPQPR